MSLEDCLKIVQNLPDKIDRLILSGGEPLSEKKILYEILSALQTKYGNATRIMLQTNGDLLNAQYFKGASDKAHASNSTITWSTVSDSP